MGQCYGLCWGEIVEEILRNKSPRWGKIKTLVAEISLIESWGESEGAEGCPRPQQSHSTCTQCSQIKTSQLHNAHKSKHLNCRMLTNQNILCENAAPGPQQSHSAYTQRSQIKTSSERT